MNVGEKMPPKSQRPFFQTQPWRKDTIKADEITMALLVHNQQKRNNVESSQTEVLYVNGNYETRRRQGKYGFSKKNSRVGKFV